MKIKRLLTALAAGLAFIALHAEARTVTVTMDNDFAATSIFFWSDTPDNMKFISASFGKNSAMADWQSTVLPKGLQLNLTGSKVEATQGLFSIKLNVKGPFSIQWAEVLFNGAGNVLQGSGTQTYNGSAWARSSTFTHLQDIPNLTAVPLPSALVLMLSTLVFVPFTRMRQRVRGSA